MGDLTETDAATNVDAATEPTGNADVADGADRPRDATDAAADGADAGLSGPSQIVLLPVPAHALVYDRTRNRLYASIFGDAAMYANTIVVIDPASSAVVSSIPVGSNPGPLALSDDDSTLWVGVTGANAIRKITLPTATSPAVVGPLVHLPLDRQGLSYFYPLSLVVLPGTPNSLVLAMSNGTPNIVVLDDGVARQTAIDMTNNAPSALVAGPPGFLFGFGLSLGNLAVMPITKFGVSQKQYSALLSGGSDGFYMGGRLYVNSGDVLDVTDPLSPSRAGQFAFSGALAPRDARNIMMTSVVGGFGLAPPEMSLRFLDPDTFTQTAALPLPIPIQSVSLGLTNLTYAGDDAVAFLVTEINSPTRLAIVHSPLIRTPVPGFKTDPDGGVGVDGADGGGQTVEECAGCTFASVPAFGRHLIYDSSRNLIYITADRAADVNKNSLVTVDPARGTVVSTLPVGGDPGPLALSDDASTLWLGNNDDRTIQRVTLGAAQVAGPTFSLPAAAPFSTTPSAAQTLVVLPGTTLSVAAGISGPQVLILDDGVPRGVVDKDRFATNSFLVRGPAGTLFGYDTYSNFGVLTYSATGVTQQTFGALLAGNNRRSMVYLAGAIYTNDGAVIDVSNPAAPVHGGRFDYLGAAITVRGPNRLLMLITDGSSTQTPVLRVLDTTTFTSVAAATFPESAIGRIPIVSDMVYIGGDAVAFLVYQNNSDQLYIMHASVIGSPP